MNSETNHTQLKQNVELQFQYSTGEEFYTMDSVQITRLIK
jgi:hypothetical protein